MEKAVIIDNVRSVLNVGSIFRTANALGIRRIILCGITPTPLDKKGNKRKDFAKVALGSEKSIVWEYCEDIREKIEVLRKEGYEMIAIEQDKKAIDYKSCKIASNKVVLIVGSEVDGISQAVLEKVDQIVDVPMLGLKESLNVTIAFAVVGYRLFDISHNA